MGHGRPSNIAAVTVLKTAGNKSSREAQHVLRQLVGLASIAVPACCRICVRVGFAVSAAKSASRIRLRAPTGSRSRWRCCAAWPRYCFCWRKIQRVSRDIVDRGVQPAQHEQRCMAAEIWRDAGADDERQSAAVKRFSMSMVDTSNVICCQALKPICRVRTVVVPVQGSPLFGRVEYSVDLVAVRGARRSASCRRRGVAVG